MFYISLLLLRLWKLWKTRGICVVCAVSSLFLYVDEVWMIVDNQLVRLFSSLDTASAK